MANIIAAAKWMQEAKQVMRTAPEEEGFRYRTDEDDFVERFARIFGKWVHHDVFTSQDLIAEDWEICNG